MQVTIDIPEPRYRELENEANAKQISVQQAAVLRLDPAQSHPGKSAGQAGTKVRFPLIDATEPGTLDLTKNLNDAWFVTFDKALAARAPSSILLTP